MLRLTHEHANDRYGPIATADWWADQGPNPLVIGAGKRPEAH